MFPALLKLTETDKRVIIALLFIIILLLVIIGAIGYLIVRVMKWQGKGLDNCVSDVLYARVITEKKEFVKYARKKNWIIFYKAARIPVIIMLVSGLILLIRNLIYHDFTYNVFNRFDGFGSLLFIWDFSGIISTGGGELTFKLPTLVSSPHFVLNAWGAYLFILGMAVGGFWYLWCVQALIARDLRIKKLSESIFDKKLDQFNQNQQLMSSLIPGQVLPPGVMPAPGVAPAPTPTPAPQTAPAPDNKEKEKKK